MLGKRDLLGGDELPDVELGPVAQRERAQLLALADAGVQHIPRLGPLVARIPSTLTIAERQDALLGAGLVLVATTAAERGIEAVLGDGVEQRHRLQPVAAGPRTGILDDPAAVDRLLHAGDDQPGTDALDELVAVLDDLGEVVTRVDVHDRKRQPSRRERQHGEMQQHRRVLAAAEQQHRVLALGGDLADDRDRLVGQRFEVRAGRRVHTCSPHSVFALPAHRPPRGPRPRRPDGCTASSRSTDSRAR